MRSRLPVAILCALALPVSAQTSPQTNPAVPRALPITPRAAPAKPAPARAVPQAAPAAVRPDVAAASIPAGAPASSLVPAGTQPERTTTTLPGAGAAARTIIPAPAADLQIQPSWETQKLARTYVFNIPAPRGQIVDRNGVPLAQSRVSYNLAIQFPSPPQFNDAEAARYIAEQTALAKGLLRRDIPGVDADRGLKHYKNRGIMPLVISTDLSALEVETIKRHRPPGIILQSAYQRVYPQGMVAGHIVGYVGRQGNYSVGEVENNELIFPNSEGRAGIERAFNEQLTGKAGVMHVSFDAQGRRSSEKVTIPPTPGQNVVLALDLRLQRLCEDSIKVSKRPGAMVITDPNNGEILALASWPSFDPNQFIPQIAPSTYALLRDDPTFPLLPRAFASQYPPGSTFKIITGLAAMNEGKVDPEDEFGGESAIEIGGITFRNWKKHDVGPLNYVQALTQSCNTYFYKMGLKCGHAPIIEYCQRLGLGAKTGLPLIEEVDGNLMTTEYMLKYHKRRVMPGDIANLSIGQGATEVTPLQLASAMGSIGNGGTVFHPRLVLQIQSVDDKITFGYEVRVRDQIDIEKSVMKALRNGMIGVVHGSGGTAHNAAIPGFKIAAKTGTAQWGGGKTERVAAWFAGFAPAEKPRYAFAAVYEGKERNDDVHGGSHAAPMVARVLKEVMKPEPKEKEKKGGLRKKRQMEEDDEDMVDDGADAPVRPKIISPPETEMTEEEQ